MMSGVFDDRREHGRRRRRRNETRDELLETMQALLESGESFSDISVERLATETGMSRTRFYMYFEDLGDLLFSAYAHQVAGGKDLLAGWWNNDGVIERAEMRSVLGKFVRFRAMNITLSRAMHACAVTDPNARRSVAAIRQQSLDELRRAMTAAQAAGSVDSTLDAEAISGWLGWLLERGVDQLVQDANAAQLRKVADSLTTIVWNTLYGVSA
jgi:TetR/AcrR family transcriptional regulator, ethionamide resistance regulator